MLFISGVREDNDNMLPALMTVRRCPPLVFSCG